MKLLYNPVSPYVRKVMITLHETELVSDVELASFFPVMPTKPNPEIIQHNPIGKVPTLILDDGTTLFDSRVICEYLDDRRSGGGIFPAPGAARWRSLTLNSTADGLLDAGVTAMLETLLRAESARSPEWLEGHMVKVRNAVDEMDRRVDASSDAFTIGEIATVCALGWLDFRMPDVEWRDGHASLADWFARQSERDSVKATVPVKPT